MVQAPDNGGFFFSLPAEGETKHGSLVLGSDTFVTHVSILADSGTTFMVSWFDLPIGMQELDKEAVLDSLWSGLNELVGGRSIGPVSAFASGDKYVRHGRSLNDQGVRLALVVRMVENRVVLMTAGYPQAFFREREELKVLRFLDSFNGDV